MADPGTLLLFFDGECALCHGLVRFLVARDPEAVFRFAPLGSATARDLLGPVEGDSVVVLAGGRQWTESDALLEIARHLPWPWRWAPALRCLPRAWRDACYRLVARNRYRFGLKDAACPSLIHLRGSTHGTFAKPSDLPFSRALRKTDKEL